MSVLTASGVQVSHPTSEFHHVQSFRGPVRPLLSEAKPSCVYSISKSQRTEFQKASPTAAEQGEAQLRIFDFKTTWSEFQKPSQTAAKQGKAELRTLDFKTTFRNSNRQLFPTKFHHLSNAILGPSSCVCQLI